MEWALKKLHCENCENHFLSQLDMPLSSALQARLIERGILNAANINAALGLYFDSIEISH